MLKKIFLLIIAINFTTKCYTDTISANSFIDKVENNNNFKEFLIDIKKVFESTERKQKTCYPDPVFTKNQKICFAVGASLGFAIIILAYGSLYSITLHKQIKSAKNIEAQDSNKDGINNKVTLESIINQNNLQEEPKDERLQKENELLLVSDQLNLIANKITSAENNIIILNPLVDNAYNELNQISQETQILSNATKDSHQKLVNINHKINLVREPYLKLISQAATDLKKIEEEKNILFSERQQAKSQNVLAKKNFPIEQLDLQIKNVCDIIGSVENSLNKLCTQYDVSIDEFDHLLRNLNNDGISLDDIKNNLNNWKPKEKLQKYYQPLEQLELQQERREKMRPIFNKIASEKKVLSELREKKEQTKDRYQAEIDKIEAQQLNQYNQDIEILNQKMLHIKYQKEQLEQNLILDVKNLTDNREKIKTSLQTQTQDLSEKCTEKIHKQAAKAKIENKLIGNKKEIRKLKMQLNELEIKKQQLETDLQITN